MVIFSAPDPAADASLAAALVSLQRASYALEAALIGDDRIPPLHEGGEQLCAWRGRWLTAWEGTELVGAAAWSAHDDHVDIAKMMVSPTATRRGIATALLGRILAGASSRDVVVATGRDNQPALSLYAGHGFEWEAVDEVPPGIQVVRLRRRGRTAAVWA